jgi:probable HAF family extracellular repeat protein
VLDVPGAINTVATGISASGELVGFYQTGTGQHAFTYINGVFTTIDPTGAVGTTPYAVNASGQVVGEYWDTNATNHGFVADPRAPLNSNEVNPHETHGLVGVSVHTPDSADHLLFV